MFNHSLKLKAKFIKKRKSHETLTDTDVEFTKENNDLFIKINDQKSMLLPQYDERIYKISDKIFQSFILTTNEGNLLIHFNNQYDCLTIKDWLENMAVYMFRSKIVSMFNIKTNLPYFSKEITLTRRQNELFIEIDSIKMKLEKLRNGENYEELNYLNNSIFINTTSGICLINFCDKFDLMDFINWIDKFSSKNTEENFI